MLIAIEIRIAAITLKGIYKKKFLNKNTLIIAVVNAVIRAADLSVAQDLILSAVLTKTAVEGAIQRNHHIKLVIPSPCTSFSLENASFVILAAIFADTIVSTIAIIAITELVFSIHASKGNQSIQVFVKSA